MTRKIFIVDDDVMLATIPGRWAAPPAPAIMQLNPRARAVFAYSTMRSGVRCALTTVSSKGTPSSFSTSAASRMTSRSLRLPMMMPTIVLGCGIPRYYCSFIIEPIRGTTLQCTLVTAMA